MPSAPLPADESGRLQTLRALRILDSDHEPAFDAIVRLLRQQLGHAMAAITLVDEHRVWFKAEAGPPLGNLPRDEAFCAHTVLTPDLLEVGDASRDHRFSDQPSVTGTPNIRAYAGAPLTVEGYRVGAVCVFDPAARALTPAHRDALHDAAEVCNALLRSRLSERHLRRQAARVRTASLSSSDWLWETDDNGRLTWVSDSIESHTGRSPTDNLGLTMQDINRRCEADTTNSWDRFLSARAERLPFKDIITDRPTPKGVVTTSISGMPVFDSKGMFRGYRGATSNITARLQAQKAARQAEQLLSDALESLVACVMISDPDGRVIRSNAAWRKEIHRRQLRAQANWPEMVREMAYAGDYPDAVGNEEAFIEWRLSIASHQAEQHEIRWRDTWLIVSGRRLPDGNVVHMSIDITDRKRAELALASREAELRDSQGRLTAVLEAVPDLWFVLDGEGRFLECSSPEHPMLIHDWSKVRGEKFGVELSSDLAQKAMNAIRLALHTGQVQRHEYALRTRDGVTRWFEARVSPMPGNRVLYVTRDLTELRALERGLMVMKGAVEAAAALPMCVCDANQPDMPMVYVNPAFETLTGFSQDELLGRNCRLLQGHMTDQAPLVRLREAIAERRECSVVVNNVRKDGTSFMNALHVAPVFDGNGELTHYIGVQHDVTDQTRAADKLRLSEELYRSVASAISDGLVVVTPTLTIIAINPAGCDVLGVDPVAVVGNTDGWPFEFMSAAARPLAHEDHPVRRVVRSGEPLSRSVHALRRPDGQLRWLELNGHPLQLRPEGSTFSVVLTFRDITQHRASELALIAAEERWKFALEGSGDGVWDWDAQTNKVYYSPRWKKMLGYAEHEIGDSLEEWTSRIHVDDLPRVMSGLRRHLRCETQVYQSEHRIRHRDGHDLWILDRGKVVGHNAEGRPLRVVGTHSDITSAKQAEQALREKQAAELASHAKSQFLSRMSHEMRTPLNAVIGFAQLMRMTPGGGDGTEIGGYADHVLNAGQHLLALINDVLDLQKVEEGAMTLAIGPVALDDTVERTLELLQPAASARRVRLDNQVPAHTWVRADMQRLRQVVLNIASNAIKYNHAGGAVRLSVDTGRRGFVTLVIEDTGPGMTEMQMARLFQPFERLGKETSNIEGTGLGLIIARSLTQAIGGKLDVSSLAGRGTHVSIELQRDDAPDTVYDNLATMPECEAPPAPSRPPLRMLYVEDNRINAILFEGALRMHNSQVELRVAEDGEEALAVASEWQPEVLVLDAHLPGMSGFDVLRELRRLPGLGTAPAYMCSADAMPDDVQRAYEAGFIGYWTKPIDIAAVLADIDDISRRIRGAAPTA
ncbi:PAS domain S-box protein [Rhizobacter sp. Root1221]|uniref:PAS domain S-box protein n=1 Tax=Rhizobacter sp. Root1221 TaxID=1736433 RepID=UPI000B17FC4D|nr:PAS domain S-box protein [Rhizobacter sp. Root1221]